MAGWIFLMPSSVSRSRFTLSMAAICLSGSPRPLITAQLWALSQIFACGSFAEPMKTPSSVMQRRNHSPSQARVFISSRCLSYSLRHSSAKSVSACAARPSCADTYSCASPEAAIRSASSSIIRRTVPNCMPVQMLSPFPFGRPCKAYRSSRSKASAESHALPYAPL